MKKVKLQIIFGTIIIGCMILGGLLSVFILGKETGEYNYIIAFAPIGGSILGFFTYFLLSKWNKKRNGNIPETDERTILLMSRYFMFVLYIVLFGSGAILLLLYAMGIHMIETGMLIVYMMILFLLIGSGALIVKRL